MPINFPDSPTTGDTHTIGDKTWTYDGTAWNVVTSSASDHGNLGGLADDDHTQYLLADGTRTATELTVSGDLTVDTDTLHVDSTNDRVGIGTTTPTDTLDVNGTLNVRDHIDFSDTTPDAANRVAIYPHGYDLYVDNAGAGTDNTRLWLNGPDEGEVVIGPRSGASTLGNMRIRSDDISLEGNVNTTGSLSIGGTAIGEFQTWTPTFFGMSAQPSSTASYAVVNGIVFWTCFFNLNGASITGSIGMEAPVPPSDRHASNYQPNGYGWLRPTGSGGSWYTGTALAIGGTLDDIYFYTPSLIGTYYMNPADNVDATTPATWTGSGYAWFTGWYEAN